MRRIDCRLGQFTRRKAPENTGSERARPGGHLRGAPRESGEGAAMPLRMRVHDREPIGAALRRFKKLLARSGLTKELRKRKYYEKPCEVRRRSKLRKQSAIPKGLLQASGESRR